MKSITGSGHAKVYLISGESIFGVNSDHVIEKFPLSCGTVGQSILSKRIMHINDLYNDPYYNSQVDLETTFPVAIIPVFS